MRNMIMKYVSIKQALGLIKSLKKTLIEEIKAFKYFKFQKIKHDLNNASIFYVRLPPNLVRIKDSTIKGKLYT